MLDNMGICGFKEVQTNYTWDLMVNRIYNVYMNVLFND